MGIPPVIYEYHPDIIGGLSLALFGLWKWKGMPSLSFAGACFRIAAFWMSVGEAWLYFERRRAVNKAQAGEETR